MLPAVTRWRRITATAATNKVVVTKVVVHARTSAGRTVSGHVGHPCGLA